MTLRQAMVGREGTRETEFQFRHGRKVFAVEMTEPSGRKETGLVFGTCPSDAIRRAKAPARFGEYGDFRAAPLSFGANDELPSPSRDWWPL